MCSTFVKITKLSQEERFMCLLLVQSFPRYFLSIPPKLNPAQTAAIFVSTQHQPNALQSHWQLHVAWHEAGLKGVSRCFLLQPSSTQGHGCATHGTDGRESLCLTCHLQCTQLRSQAGNFFPHSSQISAPTMNSCKGKSLDRFSSPRTPASVCARDGKSFQISFWGDLWKHRNQLTSPEHIRQHLVAPQFGGWQLCCSNRKQAQNCCSTSNLYWTLYVKY